MYQDKRAEHAEMLNRQTWLWAANRFAIYKNISPYFAGQETGIARYLDFITENRTVKLKAKPEKSKSRVNESAKRQAQRLMELEADEEANAKEDYDQDNGQVSNTVLEHVRSCIIKALKENESDRIDYMKTIVDPNCFATTIENMFHVSFLVKKKELAVSIDRNELMWLVNVAIPNVPMKKRIRTDRSEHDVGDVQTICNMDMKGWKDLVQCFRDSNTRYRPYIQPL